MTHFKGTFWGIQYDHSYPPPRHFANAENCRLFKPFIEEELINRLKSGAISYIGPVGKVKPPRIVSPITIEPSKPRLCINLMYLNCFMKDTPFTLDSLILVPKIIRKNSFMTKLDDKSGYDNVEMTETSKQLLGFQWGGHFFCCNTLPFGWKNSAYVYHTINLQAISYLRNLGISCLLYIDDRLIEQYHGEMPLQHSDSFSRATYAIKYAVNFLTNLGYFLNIEKSVFQPNQSITFLGFIVDSVNQSFFITQKRKMKFKKLRETILASSEISISLLQKFVGTCISFSMAIPGAKLYTNVCNGEISKAAKSKRKIVMVPDLLDEISHWEFIDEWTTPFPWINERHAVLSLSSDASNYKWGSIVKSVSINATCSDFWTDDYIDRPIMIKEAVALLNSLLSLKSDIKNKRVIAKVDNNAVVHSWHNQYSKNQELNGILKKIFQLTYEQNCALTLEYIPSAHNPADFPSRSMSNKLEATISRRTWLYVQYLFGKHSCDMFSLDSNAMKDENGELLEHFTPCPTPLTSGTDAFAQSYNADGNYYAFPPFSLIPSVIQFIIQERIICTLLVPRTHPTPPWYALLKSAADCIVTVGFKGDKGVLLYPSCRGYKQDKFGLPWDLLAVRFTHGHVTKQKNVCNCKPSQPRCKSFVPVLVVSDSMLRFLCNRKEHVKVIAVGGAKLLDTLETILNVIPIFQPLLLVIHSGTNNINKFGKPGHVQRKQAEEDINYLFSSVKNIQSSYSFAVAYSSCIYTQDPDVNSRITILNKLIRRYCNVYNFSFIDNSNIKVHHLKDFVHLNKEGETILEKNLFGLL